MKIGRQEEQEEKQKIEMCSTLGERMRFLRKQNKYTQRQMAEMLSISLGSYNHYENDIYIPNGNIIRQLAIIFNVSSDLLLGINTEKQ